MDSGEVFGEKNARSLSKQQERFWPQTHNECRPPPTVQSSDITFDTVPSLTSSLSAIPVTPRKTLGQSIWFRERTLFQLTCDVLCHPYKFTLLYHL